MSEPIFPAAAASLPGEGAFYFSLTLFFVTFLLSESMAHLTFLVFLFQTFQYRNVSSTRSYFLLSARIYRIYRATSVRIVRRNDGHFTGNEDFTSRG